MFENWMGGGPKPAAAAPTNTQQTPAPNGGGNNTADNNNDIPDDNKLVEDVFQELQPKKKDGDDTQIPPNNGGGGNNDQQVDPKKLRADHLESMGLTPVVLSEDDKQAIKDGTYDFDGLVGAMNQRVENAYMGAMRNVNKIVKEAVELAVTQAGENTHKTLEGQRLKNFLHEGIPWIKGDPIVEPIAETAFGKFMKMTDGDQNKARELTKKFLNRTADAVNQNNPEYGNSGTFRGNPQADHHGDTDWLKAFRSSK